MKGRGRAATWVAGCATALLACGTIASQVVWAPDDARATHGCAADSRNNVERNTQAIVFLQGTQTFGCKIGTGSTFPLNVPVEGNETRVSHPRPALETHLVATALDSPGFTGRRIVVQSLATGRHTVVGGGNGGVRALVLRRDGGGAAIANVPALQPGGNPVPGLEGPTEVQLWNLDGERVVADRGDAIQPDSLALSDDRTRVFWMNGDEPRSAPLP